MQVEACNMRTAVTRENTFSWACLNKVTVLLGLSSVLTLYPVLSLSRKLAAHQRSFVKCMYVFCVILSRKVWITYRRVSPARVGCNWPVCHFQRDEGNSCVKGKSMCNREIPRVSKHDNQSFWFLAALNQNSWQIKKMHCLDTWTQNSTCWNQFQES